MGTDGSQANYEKLKRGSWRQPVAVRQDHFNKEQTPLASSRCQPTVSRWFFQCLEAHLGL
jgi:hypothetical protein